MKKAYRIFIFTFALMVLLTHFVKFELVFAFLLPTGFHNYPVPYTISSFEYAAWKILLNWIMPLLCSILFVIFAGLADKIVNKKGFILVQIAVIIWLLRIAILYMTTFIEGGGATFVAAYFLSMLSIPLKIIGLIGLILSFVPSEKQKKTE
ncbi:hypothetical protein [Wielerella bovis]|uniref:hypothetical protein n=1 Tax=Wielerella bovis TaxID=2917790 RepID=UPI002018D90E|nr:hypothetical protein [Wielerella bovis]MCG7656710.1 hypothetical protein [Wielerella bovis]MCG7658933.1 hypothetical protein [Wielerella bovis]